MNSESETRGPWFGELWSLAWDGEQLGQIVVASVHDGFVLAWPVTYPPEPSYNPGIVHAESSATVWPSLETGIGTHLLHRQLGKLYTPQEIQNIATAIDTDHTNNLPWATRTHVTPENAADYEQKVGLWQGLCHHTGDPGIVGD